MRRLLSVLVILVWLVPRCGFAQAGLNDDRVMLQGFYWESYRHGDPDPRCARYGTKRWYQIVKERAPEIHGGRLPKPQVRRDVSKYLLQLKSFGYRGWRYDMVHGYHAKHLALYNRRSEPTFSVGEYDWGAHAEQRGWVWWTATNPSATGADHLKSSSSVFDFSTTFALSGNKGNYRNWYAFDNGLGMIGDNTDGLPWKNRAVTFLENHDTGYRTDDDGNPQEHHESDRFLNGWEVEQGYAYILTHPGVPCVYWKHYFDWGLRLRQRIEALINARKVAGVHAGSALHVQQNAKARGVYAATVEGRDGDLYVRVGGSDDDWEPSSSGYSEYREYAFGDGWKVWVRLPGNPPVQQAPFKAPFPVPNYRSPETIDVPDRWLD
jgi:alpha-amylase